MKILITTDWYEPVINGVVTSVVNLSNGQGRKEEEGMSYYLDDKKLKKYALFKNTVDNAMILVYYSTSTAIQKS